MPGLCFEEFEPGAVIEHPTRRTVTEMDDVLFSDAERAGLMLKRSAVETAKDLGGPR